LLAALLHRLPRDVLKGLHLVVRPDTVLRWHRDVVDRRHAQRSRPRHPGRPRTLHSIRVLVLRMVRENPGRGYRRVHGELRVPGVTVAASTVREILQSRRLAGIVPCTSKKLRSCRCLRRNRGCSCRGPEQHFYTILLSRIGHSAASSRPFELAQAGHGLSPHGLTPLPGFLSGLPAGFFSLICHSL
jgi:hypothetical protein